MVAMFSSADSQVTALLVASGGAWITVNCSLSPTPRVRMVGSIEILSRGISVGVSTLQLSVHSMRTAISSTNTWFFIGSSLIFLGTTLVGLNNFNFLIVAWNKLLCRRKK